MTQHGVNPPTHKIIIAPETFLQLQELLGLEGAAFLPHGQANAIVLDEEKMLVNELPAEVILHLEVRTSSPAPPDASAYHDETHLTAREQEIMSKFHSLA